MAKWLKRIKTLDFWGYEAVGPGVRGSSRDHDVLGSWLLGRRYYKAELLDKVSQAGATIWLRGRADGTKSPRTGGAKGARRLGRAAGRPASYALS